MSPFGIGHVTSQRSQRHQPRDPNGTNCWVERARWVEGVHRNVWANPIAITVFPCQHSTKGWDGSDGTIHRAQPSSPGAWEGKDRRQEPRERAADHSLLPGREVGAAESAADQAKGGSAMATVELLMIGVVFATGAITGVVFLVSLASRREDRREKLSREAPDRWSLAGRVLTGLYVRRPGDDSPRLRHPDDDPTQYSGPPRSGPRE
jgi:hypothetical protein